MPPSHRAFAFRYSAFEAELKPPFTVAALERYYDSREDIGLGLTWQRYQDTRAVLGRELPGVGYVQSEADVLAAIARVEPAVAIEGDRLLEMLRAAADRGFGLLVRIV